MKKLFLQKDVVKVIMADISVITPVYLATHAKISILKDNIKRNYEFISEFVLVFSAPTVEEKIITENFESLTKVKCIINKEHYSASKNRNIGISSASSPFLYFLDDDDFVTFEAINKINLTEGNYCIAESTEDNFSQMIVRNFFHHSLFLFHRDHMTTWNEKYYPGEDWLFVYSCIQLNYCGSRKLLDFEYSYSPKIYKITKSHAYSKIIEDNRLTRDALAHLQKAIDICELENRINGLISNPKLCKLIARIAYRCSLQ